MAKRPWSDMDQMEIPPEILVKIAEEFLRIIKKEALRDFTQRGWAIRDPKGGPDLPRSFSYKIKAGRVEIYSTFYGLKQLTEGDIPERKMTWLTQEYKKEHPENFELTDGERKRGMSKTGKRMPLVVPLKSGGSVIFRVAPLQMRDAWVHPGVAKFTFVQRALKKGREAAVKAVTDYLLSQLAQGDILR